MDKWEKDFNESINRSIENGSRAIGNGIKKFFKGVFLGAKKLKERKFLIGFIVTVIIAALTWIFKDKLTLIPNKIYRYFTLGVLLFSPLLYLYVISAFESKMGKEFVDRLEAYKFYGVDGKLPIFMGKNKDDFGLDVLEFKAAIPLKTWESKRAELESLFNRTIVSIAQENSKDRVLLKTIPGNVKIPDRINWKDDYLNYEDGVVVIGRTAVGEIKFDLNKTPHVLSAGETGSGKSVILRLILWQLLNQGCKAYMIDFKGGVGAKRWFEISSEMMIGIA